MNKAITYTICGLSFLSLLISLTAIQTSRTVLDTMTDVLDADTEFAEAQMDINKNGGEIDAELIRRIGAVEHSIQDIRDDYPAKKSFGERELMRP